MLTPDQVRLRLQRVVSHDESDTATRDLVALLIDVLPDLVARASGRSDDDAGRRYGGGVPGRLWTERR